MQQQACFVAALQKMGVAVREVGPGLLAKHFVAVQKVLVCLAVCITGAAHTHVLHQPEVADLTSFVFEGRGGGNGGW